MTDTVYFVRIWLDDFPEPTKVFGRIKEEDDNHIIIESGRGKRYVISKSRSKYEMLATDRKFEVQE